MRVLSRTWQMLLKGIAEVKEAARPLAAAEMVLVRIAYAADLPTPDEVIRSLERQRQPAAAAARQRRRRGDGERCDGAAPARFDRRAASPRRRSARGARAGCSRIGRAAPRRRGCRARRRSPQPFDELIALAGEKRDLALKIALERDVRLVRFEDGRLELALGAERRADTGQRPVAQALTMDRSALDGGGFGRAGRADREDAERARQAELMRGVAPIRWCRRCSIGFPAPRSSRCARPTPEDAGGVAIGQSAAPTGSMTAMPPDDAEDASSQRRSRLHGRFHGHDEAGGAAASKMQAMQAELDQIEVDGIAGGGLVTVTLSGKGDLKGVKIDASLLKPEEKEIVEDLIVAAHADAKRKAEAMMQDKMKASPAACRCRLG